MELNLVTKVTPGQVTTNFETFKAMVEKEMKEKYKSIVVTDEHLQEARTARATLNKAKESLKQTVRSMKAENEKPMETALNQAKELERILDDAIQTLDSQIKQIEQTQRSKRRDNALNMLSNKIDKLKPELITFAADCMGWLVNERWGLTGISFTELDTEINEKVERIKNAWQLLQGDYRPQMLAEFQKTGDLAKAQLYGKELERQREAFAEKPKKVEEPKQPELTADIPTSENKEQINIVYDNPAPRSEVVIEAPETYDNKDNSRKKVFAVYKLTCMRYQMEWFMAVCQRFGITLERVQTKKEGE